MATRYIKRTAHEKRRRAEQRDITGGALLSIANALEASHTALQTLLARNQAVLSPKERRALGKLASQLALVERYLQMIGKQMSRSRDTRPQQAQWNGDGHGG